MQYLRNHSQEITPNMTRAIAEEANFNPIELLNILNTYRCQEEVQNTADCEEKHGAHLHTTCGSFAALTYHLHTLHTRR